MNISNITNANYVNPDIGIADLKKESVVKNNLLDGEASFDNSLNELNNQIETLRLRLNELEQKMKESKNTDDTLKINDEIVRVKREFEDKVSQVALLNSGNHHSDVNLIMSSLKSGETPNLLLDRVNNVNSTINSPIVTNFLTSSSSSSYSDNEYLSNIISQVKSSGSVNVLMLGVLVFMMQMNTDSSAVSGIVDAMTANKQIVARLVNAQNAFNPVINAMTKMNVDGSDGTTWFEMFIKGFAPNDGVHRTTDPDPDIANALAKLSIELKEADPANWQIVIDNKFVPTQECAAAFNAAFGKYIGNINGSLSAVNATAINFPYENGSYFFTKKDASILQSAISGIQTGINNANQVSDGQNINLKLQSQVYSSRIQMAMLLIETLTKNTDRIFRG